MTFVKVTVTEENYSKISLIVYKSLRDLSLCQKKYESDNSKDRFTESKLKFIFGLRSPKKEMGVISPISNHIKVLNLSKLWNENSYKTFFTFIFKKNIVFPRCIDFYFSNKSDFDKNEGNRYGFDFFFNSDNKLDEKRKDYCYANIDEVVLFPSIRKIKNALVEEVEIFTRKKLKNRVLNLGILLFRKDSTALNSINLKLDLLESLKITCENVMKSSYVRRVCEKLGCPNIKKLCIVVSSSDQTLDLRNLKKLEILKLSNHNKLTAYYDRAIYDINLRECFLDLKLPFASKNKNVGLKKFVFKNFDGIPQKKNQYIFKISRYVKIAYSTSNICSLGVWLDHLLKTLKSTERLKRFDIVFGKNLLKFGDNKLSLKCFNRSYGFEGIFLDAISKHKELFDEFTISLYYSSEVLKKKGLKIKVLTKEDNYSKFLGTKT